MYLLDVAVSSSKSLNTAHLTFKSIGPGATVMNYEVGIGENPAFP